MAFLPSKLLLNSEINSRILLLHAQHPRKLLERPPAQLDQKTNFVKKHPYNDIFDQKLPLNDQIYH